MTNRLENFSQSNHGNRKYPYLPKLSSTLGVAMAAMGGYLLDQPNAISQIGGSVLVTTGGALTNEYLGNPVEHVVYKIGRDIRTRFTSSRRGQRQ